MNRFTIDEDDETEVTQVYNVKNGTQEEYEKCFSKSLVIARESETPNTYHHFIIGYSTVDDDKKPWYTKMLSFFRWFETDSLILKIFQLIVDNQSRLDNGFALTVLHGSKSLNFFSANHQKWHIITRTRKINLIKNFWPSKMFGIRSKMFIVLMP